MSFDDMRFRGDAVRNIPLEEILIYRGAVRNRRDKRKWHTEAGPISITGSKFMNWHRQVGGGGAIDLVMHLGAIDYREAVAWLEKHFHSRAAVLSSHVATTTPSDQPHQRRALQLPIPVAGELEQVRRYLIERRCLAAGILNPLIAAEKIYADRRGNAVFVMVAGKANRPIGAELRGTGHQVWRGMAAGSRKDAGYFWVGDRRSSTIVLCESAIDAISCFQLQRNCICISTAGVRDNPPWLRPLITRGFNIYCGFDADPAGDATATAMISRHSSIQRLRPSAHDWNDVLRNRTST